MKLIMLHGPPAAGKLTIAKALSLRTGFKVFHNHLSIDCTRPVFTFGTPAFWRINVTIRREVITAATRNNIDLVHTFCYAKGTEDDEFFGELITAAEDNGAAIHAVVLGCRDEVRKQRIADPSRIAMGKLSDPDSVDLWRDKADLLSAHPRLEDRTFFVDTSDISPDEAATLIIEKLALTELERTEQ